MNTDIEARCIIGVARTAAEPGWHVSVEIEIEYGMTTHHPALCMERLEIGDRVELVHGVWWKVRE